MCSLPLYSTLNYTLFPYKTVCRLAWLRLKGRRRPARRRVRGGEQVGRGESAGLCEPRGLSRLGAGVEQRRQLWRRPATADALCARADGGRSESDAGRAGASREYADAEFPVSVGAVIPTRGRCKPTPISVREIGRASCRDRVCQYV